MMYNVLYSLHQPILTHALSTLYTLLKADIQPRLVVSIMLMTLQLSPFQISQKFASPDPRCPQTNAEKRNPHSLSIGEREKRDSSLFGPSSIARPSKDRTHSDLGENIATFCPGRALGDERHCIFECPRFDGHRLNFPQLFDGAHDAMRTLVWHKDQKAVSALILAICTEA